MPPSPNDAPRILIVDDDPDIQALVVGQLKVIGHSALGVGSAGEAEATLQVWKPHVVVLDLNLPDGDGLKLCQRWRAAGGDVAIIMVTARSAAVDRVLGLEVGADDYLTKPFEPRELVARIRNLLKRRQAPLASATARSASFGPWRLDLIQRRLIDPDGALVLLSSAEFRLLKRFLDAPRQVLSRQELLPERSETVAFDRSLDVQISRLRQKLAAGIAGDELILTVRNEGYLFTAEALFE